jgi:translation initiation factor IF-3
MDVADALKLAEERETDLVEVSPDASPPVCRILDYGKLKYQQKKKSNQKKKKAPQQKEIRIRPKIGDHDKLVKLKQARQFIEDGDKVLVCMNFRGREMAHMEVAKKIMDDWAVELGDIAKVEKSAKLEGRRMTMVLTGK